MSALCCYFFLRAANLDLLSQSHGLSTVLQLCHVIAFYCFTSGHAQCSIISFSDCVYFAGFSAGFRNQDYESGKLQFAIAEMC